MNLKISIILPTNRQRFLKETIDSIMAQTLQDFELIILDGDNVFRGSKDERIVHVDVQGMGLSAIINHGIDIAKTDIVSISCDDDIDLPHKLQTVYDAINNGADVFYASFQIINENGSDRGIQPAQPFDFDGFILKRHTICLHSGGYRKSVSPRWREDLFLLGDYALIIEMYRRGLNIVTSEEPTIKVRSWADQLCDPHDKIKHQTVLAENKRICDIYNLRSLNR